MGVYKIPFLLVLLLIIVIVAGIFYSNAREKELYSNYVAMDKDVIKDTDNEYSMDKIFVYAFNGNVKIYSKGSKLESDMYIGYGLSYKTKSLDKQSNSSNYKVWDIDSVHEVKRLDRNTFISQNKIVTNGEWDLALQEEGANDFIGGSIHGDEIVTEFKLFVDNEEVKLDDVHELEADQVVLEMISDLYRDSTISEEPVKIGTRNKMLKFTTEGLQIDQEIEFLESMKLDKSYLTMLPILRKSNGLAGSQITDEVIFNDEKYQVSESGFNIPDITFKTGNYVEISGKESGYSAIVEILEKTPAMDTLFMLSNSETYNKVYFSFNSDGYEVKQGDIWKHSAFYKIDTAN